MRVLSEKYRKLFLLQNFQDQMQQRSRTFCRCLWVHCVTVLDVGIPAVLSVYFDWFSGIMQAFIFCMLTVMYIANAAEE